MTDMLKKLCPLAALAFVSLVSPLAQAENTPLDAQMDLLIEQGIKQALQNFEDLGDPRSLEQGNYLTLTQLRWRQFERIFSQIAKAQNLPLHLKKQRLIEIVYILSPEFEVLLEKKYYAIDSCLDVVEKYGSPALDADKRQNGNQHEINMHASDMFEHYKKQVQLAYKARIAQCQQFDSIEMQQQAKALQASEASFFAYVQDCVYMIACQQGTVWPSVSAYQGVQLMQWHLRDLDKYLPLAQESK